MAESGTRGFHRTVVTINDSEDVCDTNQYTVMTELMCSIHVDEDGREMIREDKDRRTTSFATECPNPKEEEELQRLWLCQRYDSSL